MKDDVILKITDLMIEYFSNDPKRINHFLKVYDYAVFIGKKEAVNERDMKIIEAAALVHDIGIKNAEEKYGYNNGKLQEEEGPAPAKILLNKAGLKPEEIDRVCYLVAHHHTYAGIKEMDYQILVEADFIVNLYEDGYDNTSLNNIYNNIFRTETGKLLMKRLYGL